MNLLDFYYRALKDYRKTTESSKPCQNDRKIYKKTNLELDSFVVKKFLCTIEEEWIVRIEKGLEFIEKAINEDRQFIRVNGEVVPIEKAKKISKDTVSHLARHSNMITHLPEEEGQDLIPDSIYMVEKLSDYAVYENRFLYLLICYLRDFLSLRLDKIQKLRLTYVCDFSFIKHHEEKKRIVDYKLSFHEERYDNPYPIADPKSDELLKRIEDAEQIVMAFLNTPLIQEVSKVAMIKPPIVKTNVLKMNNNFKNSLALYDYIVAFKGDGFTSEEVVKEYFPASDTMVDELIELPALTSFLTYKYGNDLELSLENEYKAEEDRRKVEESNKLKEQIKKLKKKVEESGLSMEEYVVLVEKRNRILEETESNLILAKNEIYNLNKKIESLESEKKELERKIVALNEVIEEKNLEIARLNQKYIDDMAALREAHKKEIMELNFTHEKEIQDLSEQHEQELLAQEERLRAEFEERAREYEEDINNLTQDLVTQEAKANKAQKEYQAKIQELNSTISSKETERGELISKYEKDLKDLEESMTLKYDEHVQIVTEEIEGLNQTIKDLIQDKELALAELMAIRVETNRISSDESFTDKERFDELEREFMAFSTFFKSEWDKTKKEIRKRVLWVKGEKPPKKGKKK